MNKVVRDSYPVAQLPEDLRADLVDVARVRIVLEPLTAEAKGARPSLQDLLAMSRPSFRNFDEVVAHIEAMRSEWD